MLFSYWFGVLFYFCAIIMFIIHSIIYGNIPIFVFLIPTIVFPLLFRIVYAVNVAIHKGKYKRIFIIFFASIFTLITIIVAFSTIYNIAINTHKTDVNGTHIGLENEFFFSKEGFNFTFSPFYTWDCVEGVVESWFSFHLILPNKRLIIIPKHIFSDNPLKNDFKGLLKVLLLNYNVSKLLGSGVLKLLYRVTDDRI
jgi:hypothetical protein